jgi:uncharacterized membrane protein
MSVIEFQAKSKTCYTNANYGGAMRTRATGHPGILKALLFANGLSLLLFVFRVWSGQSLRFAFLPWNLVLAWVPVMLAASFSRYASNNKLLRLGNIILLLLWLSFLPNSFYIVSDLIHLYETGEVNVLYDATLFFSFIFNGYVAGFLSVYIVHAQLLKRFTARRAHAIIAAVFLVCGFAIYLGRYMRWNTWDVLLHPLGVLFDASERVINPVAHPETIVTTGTFFLLLCAMYAVVFQFVLSLKLDTANAVRRWLKEQEAIDANSDAT